MTEAPSRGVLIVSGIPGAGKTTVSRLIAASLPYSAYIDGDVVHELVYSGRVYLAQRPSVFTDSYRTTEPDEIDKQLALQDHNVAALANNLVEAGFLTIIDDVFAARRRLNRMLDLLDAAPVFMVTLDVSKAVAEERDLLRPAKTVFPTWSHLYEIQQSEMQGIGCWVDSTHQTADETASEVLARVWDEGLVKQT